MQPQHADSLVLALRHAAREMVDRRSISEGPCITAVEYPPDDGVVLAENLTPPPDTDRWPHFAPKAVAHGSPKPATSRGGEPHGMTHPSDVSRT